MDPRGNVRKANWPMSSALSIFCPLINNFKFIAMKLGLWKNFALIRLFFLFFSVDRKKLETLYSNYQDLKDADRITVDGMVRFLGDVQVDPSSKSCLLLVWKLQAKTPCEFTREEFIQGMIALG